MTRVVCIGECMVEMRAIGPDRYARGFAGDVYNTAVYFKRSFPDAHVQLLTATGDDAMSAAMRLGWRAEGIDPALAFTVKHGTPGLYVIETNAQGERRFQYWRSQSAARRWLALLLEQGESILWDADIIYLSGITLAILSAEERSAAIEMLKRLRSRGRRIAFDPNVRLTLWETPQIAAAVTSSALSLCDIALPSAEDLSWLLHTDQPREQLAMLRAMGVREVALTLGAAGCQVSDGDTDLQLKNPATKNVVDTSGAGDSFNGVYLAKRLQGFSPSQAAEAAVRVASRVVTHAGALVPIHVSHVAENHAQIGGQI
jgi:2-dehydro-3-deoxygluconokinase